MTRRAVAVPTPAPRRPYWLIGLGVAAALAFAVWMLPAQVLAGRLAPLGLEAAQVSGTVWNGRIGSLARQGVPIGELRWQARPAALLRARLGARLQLTRPDGHIEALVYVGPPGRVELQDLRGELPIESVAAFTTGLPRGWRGMLQAQFDELRLERGVPVGARGRVQVQNLTGPPPRSFANGSYEVVFPHPDVQSANDELDALIEDRPGGPFDVEARLTLGRNRNWELAGGVAAVGSVPAQVRQAMELLGPPDAHGRREFSIAGTL